MFESVLGNDGDDDNEVTVDENDFDDERLDQLLLSVPLCEFQENVSDDVHVGARVVVIVIVIIIKY